MTHKVRKCVKSSNAVIVTTVQYRAFVGIFFNFNKWCTDMSTFKSVTHSFRNKNYVIIIIIIIIIIITTTTTADLTENVRHLLVLCWEF
jgi:hypothetical protein